MVKSFVEEFDHLFYYGGNDLGNIYTAQHTKFRVWALRSEAKLLYKKWNDKIGTEINTQQGERAPGKQNLGNQKRSLLYV